MSKSWKRILYRVFCFLSLVIVVYLIVDLRISRTLDLKMITVFLLFLTAVIWGTVEWKLNNDIIQEQEKEIKMYELYIQPMEELVKEIRAAQHEFDNHLNAIVNMHLTVDSYEELVENQFEYIKAISRDGGKQYLPLLRISDKVLAGFLYSKIVSSRENIETEIEVRSKEIISRVSEHSMIEIVGVLVDNAYEACPPNGGKVKMILDSRQDYLIFQICNRHEKVSLEKIGSFFENGYSTKNKKSGNRGLGLYRARFIVEKAGGEITVAQKEIGGENYIQFTVVI